MRTVFKSSSDADAIRKEMENLERDIENLTIIIDTVTIHLGKDVIPRLKRQKLSVYKHMLSNFGQAEIKNAHSIATFWNQIAENKYIIEEIMSSGGNTK
jgi:hypothetical protein